MKKFEFKLSIPEADTIREALKDYLTFLRNRIIFEKGDPKIIEETVAYHLLQHFDCFLNQFEDVDPDDVFSEVDDENNA